MAITVLLEGVPASRVTVGTSPLAELMACLHVMTEQEHHQHQQQWAHATTAKLSAQIAASLGRFAPLWARYRCRLMLPLAPPLNRDLGEELLTLAELEIDVFAEFIAYAIVGVQLGGFETILHEPARQNLVLRDAERRSLLREELAERLFADPERLRAELISVLQDCREAFFDEYWDRVHERLTTASTTLVRRMSAEPLPEVFASLGPGTRLERSPDRVVYDKLHHAVVNLAQRQCLVIPSVQSFPHLLVKSNDTRWPAIIHAPLRPGLGTPAPSLTDIKARIAALTAPQRIVLCRHLAGEASTTSELSRRTGMSPSQVSRHLARLKASGLITSTPQGRFHYHRLSTDVVERLGLDLLSAIVR